MASHDLVPFFVLRLDENNGFIDEQRLRDDDSSKPSEYFCRARAVFTVPEDLADTLIAHPILCRSSAFELRIDQDASELLRQSAGRREARSKKEGKQLNCPTAFLSTEYYSPVPEDTASEISKRLAIRMDNADSFTVEAGILGL